LLEIKMSRFEELHQILGEILQENPSCYWLYGQILNRLREVRPDILEGLEERGDKGYGRGGGEYYGPNSAIAHCLQDWPECVDVQYLSGRGLQIADIEVDNDAMAIYRWIGET
jgi:hypothetical protein